MSADRDVTRIVESWLEEGVTSLPDRVLDSVLDQLPATPQRRARRPAWRLNTMTTPVRIAAAAAAIGVLAVVGGIVPRATGPGGNDLVSSPSPLPAASPMVLPVSVSSPTELEAGTTYLYDDLWGDGSTDLVLTVPAAGWLYNGYATFAKGPNASGWTDVLITAWWRPRNLSADPCHSRSGGELDPPVGPTADDLVTALVAQAAGNASAPIDVTVGGHPAKRVALWPPADLDAASCEGGANDRYLRWFDEDDCCQGPSMYPEADGRNIVYILEVGGTRAVIDTLYKPGTSEADLAEAEQLVASMRFEWRAPSPSPSTAPSAAG